MSFNTYGRKETTIGGGNAVWRKVNAKYQSGGVLDLHAAKFVPAGTPVSLDPAGNVASIVESTSELTTAVSNNHVIGFIENDVNVLEGETGTCAIVVDGELYVDRVNVEFATMKAVADKCPKVTLIYDLAHNAG